MQIKLPNITRVNKKKGIVEDAYRIAGAMESFSNKFKFRTWRSRLDSATPLFMYYYDHADAVYRRDFLGEWLESEASRTSLEEICRAFPSKQARPVSTHDCYGNDLPDSVVRNQINIIKKHVLVPETLELIAQLPGASKASADLRNFATRTRKKLNRYVKLVKPIKNQKQFTDKKTLDWQWANKVFEKIYPFLKPLSEIIALKEELNYYKLLCSPYEIGYRKGRIPYCRPEFLDPEERTGTIINAYHPCYWQFELIKKGETMYKRAVKKTNVPNDIYWGKDARSNYVQGPNSQGKTVYLETAGLNIHLAMAGLYCFADSCSLSMPGRLFSCIDMGDTLATGHFETGGRVIDAMLKKVKKDSIVFLDEAGRGTEPEAERIIASGLSDGLLEYGITFFCVTHDKDAWEDHKDNAQVKLLRVADLNDKKREYKVWEGIASSGYAMLKAKQMGIDPASVKRRLAKRLG
jgi:DNA mismatch repair ATPase MutS